MASQVSQFARALGSSSIVRYGVGVGALVTATAVYKEVKDARDVAAGDVTLVLDLEKTKAVEERAGGGGGGSGLFAALRGEKSVTVSEAAEALRLAAPDDRIASLFVTLPGSGVAVAKGGIAAYQELRGGLVAFTKAKRQSRAAPETDESDEKRAPVSIAWTSSFGEMGSGIASYYLATGCDTILMQPSGMLAIVGLGTTSFFLRELLDTLKIRPTVVAREEYKNALNTYTEKDFTRAHAERTRSFLESIYMQLVDGISEAREIRPWRVRRLVNSAPLNAKKSLKAGLIDGTAYRDEVLAIVKGSGEEAGAGADADARPKPKTSMSLQRYLRIRRSEEARETFVRWARAGFKDDDARVVLVTLAGQIRSGTAADDRWAKSTIWSKDAAAKLRAVREKASTKAVVLRVNSPGGSALGSDEVRREVELLKAAGKPVVVSMGSVAASGGYMIACGADAIVAQPGTLTGSIGVIFGKFNIERLLQEYGINPKSIFVGDNASLTSSTEPLSRRQLRWINAHVDEIYSDFMGVVAAGRQLSSRHVRSLAKGQIWSGTAATKNGLVDELGGIDVAIARAKELAVQAHPESVGSLRVVEHKESALAKLLAGDASAAGATLGLDVVDLVDTLGSWVVDALAARIRSRVAEETGIPAEGVHMLMTCPPPHVHSGGVSVASARGV